MPEPLAIPKVASAFTSLSSRFDEFKVVLRPDTIEPGWWAGAPSVCVDDDGTFWLACRMRTGEGERGLRGYEIRILRSEDGERFEEVNRIHRNDVPIPGFERPALLRDPRTGRFKLYGCGPWQGGAWGIFKFDDAKSPERFNHSSAKLVIAPPEKQYDRDVAVVEYKDPFIIFAQGKYHCYVTGYMRRNERIYHFSSADGEHWEAVGDPYESIVPLSGWHDFFTRPASVVPVGVGYLFIYEGSKASWYDPVYNIATGLGFTFDLHEIIDLSPRAPLLVSSTPSEHFATFRYSDWLLLNDELWVYAEVACADGTNEIRVFRAPCN